MIERIAEVVVLAEDLNQGNFARRYLIRAGHDARKVAVRLAPPGKGSGEQYVREHYPIEVKYYRHRSSSRSAALLVTIDADVGAVADREAELAASLARGGEAPRQPADAISLLIPKRNIETWVLCLSNEVVDEVTDYKGRKDIQQKIRPAAEIFFDWSRANFVVPTHCVPSLRRGLTEVRRLG